MKLIRWMISLLIVFLLIDGCLMISFARSVHPLDLEQNATDLDDPVQPNDFQLDKTEVYVPGGFSFKLNTNLESYSSFLSVEWKSSDSNIAEVGYNGTVKTKKLGTTVISAKYGEQTATCVVNVTIQLRGDLEIFPTKYISSNNRTDKLTVTVPANGVLDIELNVDKLFECVFCLEKDNGEMVFEELFSYVDDFDFLEDDWITYNVYAEAGTYYFYVKDRLVGRDYNRGYEINITMSIYEPYPVQTMAMNRVFLSLVAGKSEALDFNYSPYYATNNRGTWESANSTIAKVDQNGKVTGVSKGKTVITVSCGKVSTSCEVTVISIPLQNIWIEVNGNTCVMKYSPSNASDTIAPVWSSSNKTIASIDKNGKVSPNRLGTTTITVQNGKTKATKAFTVSEDTKEYSLFLGEKLNLRPRMKYVAGYKDATWRSNNENAKVNQKGVVRMIAGGIATITATVGKKEYKMFVRADTVAVGGLYEHGYPDWGGGTYYYSFSNYDIASLYDKDMDYIKGWSMGKTSYTITKDNHEEVRKITVNSIKKKYGITLAMTKSFSDYIVNIENYETAKWKSTNKTVATVNKNGSVKAVGKGSADIIATIDGVKYTIHVYTVIPQLNYTGYQFNVGDTAQLKLGNVKASSVKWSSANTSIVTVNSAGKITAKGRGISKVIAVYAGQKYECKIDVNEKGFATLKGTVTYYFNSNYGYVADTNAKIYVQDTYNHRNVVVGTADGVGNYDIRVPIGFYRIVIMSSHTDKCDFTLLGFEKNDEKRFDTGFSRSSLSKSSFQKMETA